MTNLPITSSNPPPAKGRAELTPPKGSPLPAPRPPAGRVSSGIPFTVARSDSPAVSTNATGITQTDGMPDAQPAEPFEALLAQQMGESATPAVITPSSAIAPSPAIAIDTETMAASASLSSEGGQDKTLAATDSSNNPASALIAMLQLPQETKAPVIKDAANSTTAVAHAITTGKTASHRPSANIDAIQARTEFGMATADHQAIHSTSSSTIANSAVLTNNLPDTPLTTQDATPSIASSDVMPNMLGNNRLPDTRQTITTPLGNHTWANEFSQKISWMSTQQNQVAELHLNPPDLGPLDVVLKVSGNQATALFTSPHGAVRDAVENALPKLRETLADNGITLGNATVSDQPPRDRGAERFISRGSGTAVQSDGSGESSGPENLLMAAAQISPVRRYNGMVDTFA